MKFTTLPLLALGVSARSLITERDLATVQQVISSVGSGISALNDAVTAFDGSDATALTDASTSLTQTITDGTATVSATDALTLQDALSLTNTVQDLTAQSQTLTDNLNGKKSAIEAAGLCATVRDQAAQLSSGSQALIDAIVSKVPTDAQTIAGQLASGLTDVLAQNSANFAEGSCVDAAGGGGGASAPASSPTSSPVAATTPPSSAPTGATQPTPTTGLTPTGGLGATGATTRPTPTGGAGGNSGNGTVVTAGAPLNAVPAAGALLLGLAALF